MLVLLLAAGCIVCGIGWLVRYVSFYVLLCYMKKQGYKLPNAKEIDECTQFVVKHLFEIRKKRAREKGE